MIEQYYKDKHDMLVKRYTRRAGTVQDAEDLVQEAFYRALKYQASFDQSRHELSTWMGGILNNCLRDFKRYQMGGPEMDYKEEPVADPDLHWVKEMQGKVREEIEKKSGNLRDVLHLYFNLGYKPREIVQTLDVRNGTVRQSVWEFKKLLRERYDK